MAVQSLYRRYRPQRFADLKGQDHVVRALRTAVADGRAGQAYLFSGPRGTGKTSTARILAKVLNCENPVDGEPCGECESCAAVQMGTSYNVHELDAASNNGVEGVRQLIEKASLGTPGRHKVYILDEVHMLTKPAEAALLKTLEEPPPHVVFVLATTDPQKVSETIRSRTQHLPFHLLPTDTLREHVEWVASDAGLEVSDEALAQVVSAGGGSARDTLSALELVAAGGGDAPATAHVDEVIGSMAARDPGPALAAVAHAISLGRDPRTIAEELIGHLRDRFLALVAPELVQVPADRLDAVADEARAVGAPALVRGIEQLGRILIEMRQAPDPRVLLDVAVVQLTSDEVADPSDTAALARRVDQLERRIAELSEGRVTPSSGAASPSARADVPRDPASGRARLGGRARRDAPGGRAAAEPSSAEAPAEPVAAPSERVSAGGDAEPTSATEPAPPADAAPADAPAPGSPPADAAPADAPAAITLEIWQAVLPSLGGRTRAMYSAARFSGAQDGGLTLSVPNQAHAGKCEQQRAEVEAALEREVGRSVRIEFVVGEADDPVGGANAGLGGAAGGARDQAARDDENERNIDLDDLVDVPPEDVKTPLDRLAEAFPGSEFVDDAT